MPSVRISNVSKSYGKGARAVDDVSLEIQDGEFLVLVGPSGCGKSTLLRMIAGLEDVSEGEVRIGDRVVNDLPPRDRDIAMVFQNYALYPHMTVHDNMAFGLRRRKLPESDVTRLVSEAAELLGLGPYLKR
jgi:ABC-type sugar transport system ATPase subunit